MPAEVQRLADELGALLSRPVTLADAHDRVIAYNVHEEGDRARADSIVMRQLTGSAASWFAAHQVVSKSSPAFFPANPDIGLTHDRLRFSVQHQGSLVALIWVSLTVAPLSQVELDHVASIADRLGSAMERAREIEAGGEQEERAATAVLIAGNIAERRIAAEQLLQLNLIRGRDCFIAIVLSVQDHQDGEPCQQQIHSLLRALRVCRLTSTVRQPLILERANHGALIVAEGRAGCQRAAERVARSLHTEITSTSRMADDDWQPSIGVGTLVEDPDDVEKSYRHAMSAAMVGTAIRALGPITRYDELGVFRILSQLPRDSLTEEYIGREVRELLRRERAGDQLARTLETYLDNAGDVVRTSADLHLHRATLYHRLRRISEAVGIDLADGTTRLSIHLELKLARLLDLRDGVTDEGARSADA
jgi:sugar diacid utilization regulator